MGLRSDTPLPIPPGTAGVTQELDPGDILEVQDMAEAIARAEKLVVAPRSSRPADMFELLGQRATDDTAGPATPAPATVTPIPPPMVAAEPTPAPRYVTMPSAPPTGLEEDAFYHPLGRMRSLADATLDGYRPEPTLLVRAASRRRRYSWLIVAALLPLIALASFAIVGTLEDAAETTSVVSKGAPATANATKTPLATTAAAAKAPVKTADAAPLATGGTPVFDVNSLPSAGAKR